MAGGRPSTICSKGCASGENQSNDIVGSRKYSASTGAWRSATGGRVVPRRAAGGGGEVFGHRSVRLHLLASGRRRALVLYRPVGFLQLPDWQLHARHRSASGPRG